MNKYSCYQDLIEFVEQYIELDQAGSSELKGNCCYCNDSNGHDRFFINWENEKQPYCYCRKCEQWAHNIQQFCYRFLKMSWQEAVQVAREKAVRPRLSSARNQTEKTFDLNKWQEKAQSVTQIWHKSLLNCPELMGWLERERGLTLDTIKKWKLGFCHREYYLQPERWGFAATEKKVYCPIGITIPHIREDGTISGINIRRFKPSDGAYALIYPVPRVFPVPKPVSPYHRIRGSISVPWTLIGQHCCFTQGQFNEPCTGPVDEYELSRRPVVIVESELDALLLWQHLKPFINVVALLSASKKPAKETLPNGPILFALDFDEAGKVHFKNWHADYQAFAAPPEVGKDITEMVQKGINPLNWLAKLLGHHQLLRPDVLNPYAHSYLLRRLYETKQQVLTLPLNIMRESTTGMVHTWYRDCHDQISRRAIEKMYQKLWGLSS